MISKPKVPGAIGGGILVSIAITLAGLFMVVNMAPTI